MQVGRQKPRFWAYIRLHCVLLTLRPARCYQQGAARRRKVVALIAGSKWRSLLLAGDDNEMFMIRSLNVTSKTTKQHLIARSDKSVAYVTINNRLCSRFCTIEANYWQTRSIARVLCDSRATCLFQRQSVVVLALRPASRPGGQRRTSRIEFRNTCMRSPARYYF